MQPYHHGCLEELCMGRISRGWQLTKMSLRIIKKDKELLLFPLISGLFTVLIIMGFLLGMFYSVGIDEMFRGMTEYSMIAIYFGLYFLIYFVSIFFNAAIIGCAMIRLNDGIPKLRDGFRIARENLGRIIAWTLFASTVGLVLRLIQQKAGVIGRIVIGFIGVAWALGTFFVVPVLIFEKIGPVTAMKRSASIFKGVWGETIVGNIGIGIIFFLAGLLGMIAIVLGAALGGLAGLIIGTAIAIVYWAALGIIASAAQSILTAALYRYATEGKVSREFGSRQLFENPWKC